MLRIIADQAIPWLDKLFAEYGDIHRFSGRELDASMLEGADVLLVRSTVRIHRDLVKNSTLKLVASATVGCDHVDRDALHEQGIAFAHAPGCNANAVAEYVVAAISWHLKQGKLNLANGSTAAIVGCGRIGSRVRNKLDVLGFDVVVNDPPRARVESADYGAMNFVSLDQALQADVVCLHTPLTHTGEFPTFHLLNQDRLKGVRDNTVLINAGRGGVIDCRALSSLLDEKPSLNVVLDVWENEPDIDWGLLSKVNLGSPHIAGHSWRGKVMGTVMIYQCACEIFGWREKKLDSQDFRVPLAPVEFTDDAGLYDLVSECYDIESETAEFRRRTRDIPVPDAAVQFDLFRKKYYRRPEFSDLDCVVSGPLSQTARSLGFNVSS